MSAESDYHCQRCGLEWVAIPPSICPVCENQYGKTRHLRLAVVNALNDLIAHCESISDTRRAYAYKGVLHTLQNPDIE